MSELSDYLADAVLNWVRSTAFPSDPAAVYVALYNGDPQGAGTEVTTTIAAAGRLAVTWSTVTARAIENTADVDFGEADGGATITHYALFDASSAGNMIASTPLDNTRVVVAGDPVIFLAGNIIFSFPAA